MAMFSTPFMGGADTIPMYSVTEAEVAKVRRLAERHARKRRLNKKHTAELVAMLTPEPGDVR